MPLIELRRLPAGLSRCPHPKGDEQVNERINKTLGWGVTDRWLADERVLDMLSLLARGLLVCTTAASVLVAVAISRLEPSTGQSGFNGWGSGCAGGCVPCTVGRCRETCPATHLASRDLKEEIVMQCLPRLPMVADRGMGNLEHRVMVA